MVKKILVSLDDDQYEILQTLKGMGQNDATKIRNIIITYFNDKNYIRPTNTKQ